MAVAAITERSLLPADCWGHETSRRRAVRRLGKRLSVMLKRIAFSVLAWCASAVQAQDSFTNTIQPLVISAPAPQTSHDMAQIVKLLYANVAEDTIIAYIKNSGNKRGLNADQIIQLRQDGASDLVITTMLNQSGPGMPASFPTKTPQPPAVSTAIIPAAATGIDIQTVPGNAVPAAPCFDPDSDWYVKVKFPFGRIGDWRDGKPGR
jgi:hypothetical protein